MSTENTVLPCIAENASRFSEVSSAMNHLTDFLTTHHPEIAEKIIGTLTLDLEALTEGQLLQEARTFFLHHDGLGPIGS